MAELIGIELAIDGGVKLVLIEFIWASYLLVVVW